MKNSLMNKLNNVISHSNKNSKIIFKNSYFGFSSFSKLNKSTKTSMISNCIKNNNVILKTSIQAFSSCSNQCSDCSCKSNSKIDINDSDFEAKLKALNYDIISCIEEGNYEEGLELSEFYIQLIKDKYGETHAYYNSALNNKGYLLKLSNKKEEAKEIYELILNNYYKANSNTNPTKIDSLLDNPFIKNIIIVKQNLATILRDLNQHQQALKHYQELFSIIKNKETRTDVNIEINILISASGSYRAVKEFQTAEQLLNAAENLILSNYGEDNLPMALLLNQKALVYKDLEKYDLALMCFRKSLEIKETVLDKEHPELEISRGHISRLLEIMGNKEKNNNEEIREDDFEIKNNRKI